MSTDAPGPDVAVEDAENIGLILDLDAWIDALEEADEDYG